MKIWVRKEKKDSWQKIQLLLDVIGIIFMILLIIALYQDKKACEFHEENYRNNIERMNNMSEIINQLNLSYIELPKLAIETS